MRYIIEDKKYHFKSAFDTNTGAYVRTGVLDENGNVTVPKVPLDTHAVVAKAWDTYGNYITLTCAFIVVYEEETGEKVETNRYYFLMPNGKNGELGDDNSVDENGNHYGNYNKFAPSWYNEYTNTPNVDLTTVVAVGDSMEAKVLKVNDGEGQVLLTYKRLAAEKGSKRLEEAFENKEVLKAVVSQVMTGGLSVVVEEARVFIPASLVSDTYEKDLSKYLGQEIEFVISEYNPKRRRYIGDRKQLLVAKKAELQKELFAKIQVGDVVEGTVKNVTDFGAFIDLGGVDGLLHISEMSWGRVESPKKVFKVGETLKVLIKEIEGTKVALSLKFDDSNPWKDAATKYAVGNEVTGKVARMTDFGAFVELEPGIDALLHVSQIAKEHIEKPSDVLAVGQDVTAKVVDFNEEGKKISLSIKALFAPEVKEVVEEEVADDADVVSVDIDAVIAKLGDVKPEQEATLRRRCECAWYWITECAPTSAPDFCFALRTDGSKADLSGDILTAVKRVRDEVVPKLETYLVDKELQQAMYDIATELGLESKALFTALYQALVAKDQGPRLAGFMKIIGKDQLNKILGVY